MYSTRSSCVLVRGVRCCPTQATMIQQVIVEGFAPRERRRKFNFEVWG